MQQLQEGRFNHDVVHATIASASASSAAAVTCCEALAHHVHLIEMQQMQKGQFNHDIVHATIASAAAAVTCLKALAHQVHLKGHRLQFAGTMRSHVLVQPCLCQNVCTCNKCNSGGSISSGNLGGQQMARSSSNDASVTSYRSSSTLLKPVHLMSNTRQGSRSQTQCTAMSTVHATNRATAAAAALCVEALAHHLNLQEGQPIAECKQFSIAQSKLAGSSAAALHVLLTLLLPVLFSSSLHPPAALQPLPAGKRNTKAQHSHDAAAAAAAAAGQAKQIRRKKEDKWVPTCTSAPPSSLKACLLVDSFLNACSHRPYSSSSSRIVADQQEVTQVLGQIHAPR
jgi:hypothetical protein